MKGKRYNNFRKALERYHSTLISECSKIKFFNLTEDFRDQIKQTIPLEDKFIYELSLQVDSETLYRSSEFNRQLRLRMKFYKLPWINKNG